MAVDEANAQAAGDSLPVNERPPRDNLIRALHPAIELRQNGDAAGGMPTMAGHFAVFNQFTEIDSFFEGHFMERIAPGAFKKTFRENREAMKVTFNHGFDPQMGDKVLGPIDTLAEDDVGAAYEVPLLDTSYNRDLVPGLEAGLYGSSFRFRVMREEFIKKPDASTENPNGLPERTIKEAQVFEFGPVTYPAYKEATAGLRSLTDDYLLRRFNLEPERLRQLVGAPQGASRRGVFFADDEKLVSAPLESVEPGDSTGKEERKGEAPRTDDAAQTGTSSSGAAEAERAETPTATSKETSTMTIQEVIARQGEIKDRQKEIYAEHGTDLLPADLQAEWDALEEEQHRNEQRIKQDERMRRTIERAADDPNKREDEPRNELSGGFNTRRERLPRDPFDVTAYRGHAGSEDEQRALMHEGARTILETAVFPHERADNAEAVAHIERVLERDKDQGVLAEHMLLTGNPLYMRAFGKLMAGIRLNSQEEHQVALVQQSKLQRALSLTGSAGGFAVPYTLDPTIIPTSNGAVNPFRQISRVVTITGNEWRGVSSAGITASYAAEAAEAGDNAPTLAQPTANVEKAQAFVPFSIEVGQDWGSLQTEMAQLLQDAKDELEASKFVTGAGHSSTEPEGILVGATAVVTTSATATITAADLYSLEEALPARFRPRAVAVGSRSVFNQIRQFDTSGGAALWVQLQAQRPPTLIGYDIYESSAYPTGHASGASVLTLGDFSKFLIVDRVGLNIEVIPHLMGASRWPTGQRGLYAFWRNTSDVNAWQAFRTLKVL